MVAPGGDDRTIRHHCLQLQSDLVSSGSSGLAPEVGDYVHHRSCQTTSPRLLVRTIRVATTPGVSSHGRLRSAIRSTSASCGSGGPVVRNRILTACEAQCTGFSSATSYILPARGCSFLLLPPFELRSSQTTPTRGCLVCLFYSRNSLSFIMQFKHLLALLPLVLAVASHPTQFRREDESSAVALPGAPLEGDLPALPGQPLDESSVFGEGEAIVHPKSPLEQSSLALDGELNTFVVREPQNLPTGQNAVPANHGSGVPPLSGGVRLPPTRLQRETLVCYRYQE
ncbi:hypothetical protein C8Q79DRAFT_954617 [Trametes meyenii]|nr:hypothetical protein C8Q79DRAFT_954617 [Trametes meyenii]